MLAQIIESYGQKFRLASERRRVDETIRYLEEMKQGLRANPPPPSEVIKYFDLVLTGAPPEGASLAFVAAWYNLSKEYCSPLVRIVETEQCRAFHEQAIELLAEVGDERAVPALKKSLAYRWGYDPWFLVPRKALRALRAIETPEAVGIISLAARSPEVAIREEAESLLGISPEEHKEDK